MVHIFFIRTITINLTAKQSNSSIITTINKQHTRVIFKKYSHNPNPGQSGWKKPLIIEALPIFILHKEG